MPNESIPVLVPDIGDFKNVDIIEVLVKPGDPVVPEQSLITLESEKAAMEVPAPRGGIVREVAVKVGDKVSQGSPILTLEVEAAAPVADAQSAPRPRPPDAAIPEPPRPDAPPPAALEGAPGPVHGHASPSVRRLARELGVDVAQVAGSGPKGRVVTADVQAHVKQAMAGGSRAAGLPPPAQVDFHRFGPVAEYPLPRIRQIAGANLHRNWVNIPHVTQFGEADITELEAFRRAEGERLKQQGGRLSLLAFFVKASVAALQRFPDFNSALHPDGTRLVQRRYYHIGVAVDTPGGLVVPVVRDAERKGLAELSRELADLAGQARARKLTPEQMQGGCFTLSSLGGIGGGHFTPIINAPEAAILGVSRAQLRPVYRDGELQPRRLLPLSLAFDHRIIDGAAAARFVVYLEEVLADVRRLLL